MDQMAQQIVDMQAQMQFMMSALTNVTDRATRAEAALAASVPVASQPAAATSRPPAADLVDTRLLTKPKAFGGQEAEWAGWSFKMLAYIGALDGDMLGELVEAAAAPAVADVQNVRMSPPGQARSRQLYYVLILLLEGTALQLVKAVPSGEGYRVWRVLQERFESSMPSRQAGLLQEIIGYQFPAEQIEAGIAEFEFKVNKYENQSGEVISEKLKIAIMQKGLQDLQIQGHLVLHAGRLVTWDAVRNEVQSVLSTRQAIAACHTTVPMEIGFVYKGKGGKKGKDKKGKDKSKSKSPAAAPAGKGKGSGAQKGGKDAKDVECFYCHKKGHYKKDCRKWLADQGKGVNELDAEESEAQPSQLTVQAMEQARTVADWVWSLEVVQEEVGQQLRARGEESPSHRGRSSRRSRRICPSRYRLLRERLYVRARRKREPRGGDRRARVSTAACGGGRSHRIQTTTPKAQECIHRPEGHLR
jgi:hypothetical protein